MEIFISLCTCVQGVFSYIKKKGSASSEAIKIWGCPGKEILPMAKVEIKQPVVDEIKAKVEGAVTIVLVDYRGLTVEQDT